MNFAVNDFKSARVLICYRNIGAQAGNASSHVGLGVNGLHTARVLRAQGIVCDLAPVWTPDQISTALFSDRYTHVVIEAPWIETADGQLMQWGQGK